MSINLSRNTRLWVSTVTTGHNTSNTFEIPVQEGYSFEQTNTSSDVTVDEAGATPTRGSKRFNDALDPVSWSFSTYVNPYLLTGDHMVTDALLWQGLAVKRGGVMDFDSTSTGAVKASATKFTVAFTDNAAHVLTPLYLYFLIDNTMYLVSQAQVGQVEISVDISDIAMNAWSGQAVKYETITKPSFATEATPGANGDVYNNTTPVAGKYVKVPAVRDFIVNKLTVMTLNSDAAPGAVPGTNNNYRIPITGATVTINNNVTFLTPSTLSEVDVPIGSFTGTFDVSGSFDAYLRNTGGNGTVGNEYGSAELLSHMLAGSKNRVTNSSNLVFILGGTAASDPKMYVKIPKAHLAIPTFAVEDIVSTTVEFKGIPSSADLVSGDEVSLEFVART